MHSVAVFEGVNKSYSHPDTLSSKHSYRLMNQRSPLSHCRPHGSKPMPQSSLKRPMTENDRALLGATLKFNRVQSPCGRGQFSSADPNNLIMLPMPQVSCSSSAEATGTAHHLPMRAPPTFRSTPRQRDLSRRSLRWGNGNHQGQHRYRRNSRQGLGRC